MTLSDTRRFVRTVGHIYASARKRRGLSQEGLAALAGFSRSTVLNVEHGRHDMSYVNVRLCLSACEMTWMGFGSELQVHDTLTSSVPVDHSALDPLLHARRVDPLGALGIAIATCRRTAHKSLDAVADDSGITRGLLLAIRRGEHSPRLGTVRRVLLTLGINWQTFFSLVHQLDSIEARPTSPR